MMETIFAYSLRSSLVLALLYIPYMLMLRRESFFRLNRIVLLFILLLSLTLPLLDIHSLAWEGLAPVQTVFRPASSGNVASVQTILLPEVTVHAIRHTSAASATSATSAIWHYVSVSVVVIMLLVFLCHVYQIVQMGVVVRRGSLWQQMRDGVCIYCHADEVSPYSWMRSVVISERDYRENGREIILHEMAHVRAMHSLDLLFLALVQTLQWWNPLVYILGISMRDVHEYQADDSVLRHGVSARDYQLLLIKKVVGSSSYAFANNFDHSLIIKRITMMQKTKSEKWMCSKVLYILPMATLALSAFATVQPTASSVNDDDAPGLSTGKVSALTVRTQAKEQKSAAIALRKSAKSAPAVTPKSSKGAPVAMSSTVIKVRKDNVDKVGRVGNVDNVCSVSNADNVDSVKVSVDYCACPTVFPRFPGGEKELYNFICKTLRYPDKAQELGIQGRVIVRFLVDKDGSIGNVSVKKEIIDSEQLNEVVIAARAKDGKAKDNDEAAYRAAVDACSEEVIRVVKAMPKWTPGYRDKEKTQPCATHFSLPVLFRLK